ncbi:four helix bundle protein [Candidatus Roizmanbacteria bacterium RIFCSPLOWO2_01_FULL_41_22]|uniref:Four helix bundle protein n=1 Tax=Candidatus Roizmanbacteria bacterium RIFCSPLOWO2_01_FULL_41_22 TaxID=1802067 RepID=A0A1F7JB63_9BACT|nr:MAG: four helix bundle protein [Candidatus Roizmanbacteria bacterium RIFCSPLOWO2_01_FULL_41_22]
MTINKFEDIIAWKKSKDLTLLIYSSFKDCRDFSFKDQIQRAGISIMNNIAEGFERKGDKELARFLYIAKGSCAEIRSMSYLAYELKYLNSESHKKIYLLSIEISKILSGFIKTLLTL